MKNTSPSAKANSPEFFELSPEEERSILLKFESFVASYLISEKPTDSSGTNTDKQTKNAVLLLKPAFQAKNLMMY